MRPAVGLLVQTPQQQLTQKVLGDGHTLGVLNSVLPNHLVSFGGHTGMWMLFGETISTLAQTIASPPPHTWGAASGKMGSNLTSHWCWVQTPEQSALGSMPEEAEPPFF